MKTYMEEEVEEHLTHGQHTEEEDNEGQIVFYTGLYRWKDGTVRDYVDPDRD
jgi:hypothetical protein